MALIKLIRNTLCVIIAMAALCSCNKTFSDSQFNKMYELNERGTIVFKGSINNKDYAAFINKYSPTNISGHSFLLLRMTSDKTQLLKAYAGQSTEIAYHQDNSYICKAKRTPAHDHIR